MYMYILRTAGTRDVVTCCLYMCMPVKCQNNNNNNKKKKKKKKKKKRVTTRGCSVSQIVHAVLKSLGVSRNLQRQRGIRCPNQSTLR